MIDIIIPAKQLRKGTEEQTKARGTETNPVSFCSSGCCLFLCTLNLFRIWSIEDSRGFGDQA
jgi:hypothetical protein